MNLFLLSGLLCCSLAAVPAEVSQTVSMEEGEGNFEVIFAEGIWAFSQYDHIRAVEYFQKASDERPEDGFSRYMLGLSLLRLGRAGEAVAAIRASLSDGKTPPPVKRSRILADLGAAQLAAGDSQAALRTLEEALRDRQNDPVARYRYAKALELADRKEEAEAALAKAQLLGPDLDPEHLPITFPEVILPASAAKEAQRWVGTVGFLAGRDSNPNLLSKELLLPTPAPDSELVSGSRSDSVASADLRVTYEPLRLFKGWSTAVDFRGGGSFHQDFGYLNLVRTGAVVQLSRGTDPRGLLEGPLGAKRVDFGATADRWTVLVQGGVYEFRLNDAPYLRTLDAAASATLSTSEANATRLDLQFQDREYSHQQLADPRRSGEEVRLGLRQIHFFNRPRNGYVSLGVLAGQRDAGRAFDRTLLQGEVEVGLPIASKWRLDLAGSLAREDFNNRESNLFSPSGKPRKDKSWGAEAALSFELTRSLQLLVRGSYDRRDSSLDLGEGLPDLDYRRTTLSSGLSWTF